MGCDIHFFVEYSAGGGKWEHDERMTREEEKYESGGQTHIDYYYRDADLVGRDYKFYGFLADVRARGSCIFEPRGFPQDASKYIKAAFKQWGGDAHTPSYLSLDELTEVIKQYRASEVEEARQDKQDTKIARTLYKEVLDFMKEGVNQRTHKCPEGLFDVKVDARAVFWFDN